ncbi:MAG: purine and other phosphorylase-like protein, family 1 [Nevskia sp.]|nr:purine and other phosphorylase-like protein, family 1 [Nevskia sp.]
MNHGDLGIVVAMATEARALTPLRPVPNQVAEIAPGVHLVLCGIGPRAAGNAARVLLDSGVRALAVLGVAGGLDPRFGSGELLVPNELVDDAGSRFAADPAWRARLVAVLAGRCRAETLLTVREPLLTPRAKAEARQRHGASAVDMEGAAVAQIAWQYEVPFLMVRAVADTALHVIPPALAGTVDRFGRPRPRALLAAMARRPALLLCLPGLARSMSRSMEALRQVVRLAGPGLAWDRAA